MYWETLSPYTLLNTGFDNMSHIVVTQALEVQIKLKLVLETLLIARGIDLEWDFLLKGSIRKIIIQAGLENKRGRCVEILPKMTILERMSLIKMKHDKIILWHFSSWGVLISGEELKPSQRLKRALVMSYQKQ